MIVHIMRWFSWCSGVLAFGAALAGEGSDFVWWAGCGLAFWLLEVVQTRT